MLGVYMALDLLLFCFVLDGRRAGDVLPDRHGRGRTPPAFASRHRDRAWPRACSSAHARAAHRRATRSPARRPSTCGCSSSSRCRRGSAVGISGVLRRLWRGSARRLPLVAAVAADGRAVAVPVLLAAVFLKMGTYGFLRLSLPLLPDASRAFAPSSSRLRRSASCWRRGGVCADQLDTRARVREPQPRLSGDARRLALTPDGVTGSVVHQINHGVSMPRSSFWRRSSAERGQAAALAEYGGLLNAMPLVAAVWLLMTLSLVGVPKLNGFVGTRLIVEGIWPVSTVWSIVAMSGMVLSGVGAAVAVLADDARRAAEPDGRRAEGSAPSRSHRVRAARRCSPSGLVSGRRRSWPASRHRSRASCCASVPQYAPKSPTACRSRRRPGQTGLPAGMVLAAPCVDGGPESQPGVTSDDRSAPAPDGGHLGHELLDRQVRVSASSIRRHSTPRGWSIASARLPGVIGAPAPELGRCRAARRTGTSTASSGRRRA